MGPPPAADTEGWALEGGGVPPSRLTLPFVMPATDTAQVECGAAAATGDDIGAPHFCCCC